MSALGTLQLEAISGHKLKKLERFLSSQDPYVVFTNSNVKEQNTGKTDTHKDASAEPRWYEKDLNRTVTIAYEANGTQPILVQVFNDNGKKQHKLIGEAQLDVSTMVQEPGKTVQIDDLQLLNKGKPAGTLKLKGTFTVENSPSQEPEAPVKKSASSIPSKDDLKKAAAKVAKEKKTILKSASKSKEAASASNSKESASTSKSKEPESTGSQMQSSNGTLQVVVKQGSNLKNLQLFLKQSPYVIVRNEHTKEEHRTKTASGVNPNWKDTKMEFAHDPNNEATVLSIIVMEAQRLKDRIIGDASIPLEKFDMKTLANGIPVVVSLHDPQGKEAGTVSLDLSFHPKVEKPTNKSVTQEVRTTSSRALEHETEDTEVSSKAIEHGALSKQGHVTLIVERGQDFRNVQYIGKQDPFVVATLLPWETGTKESGVASGVNPVWNQSEKNRLVFEYFGNPGENQIPKLQVQVFDAESMKSDRIIGSGTVDITQHIISGAQEDITIKLSDPSYKAAGSLFCSIQFQEGPLNNDNDILKGEKLELSKYPLTSDIWDCKGMVMVEAQSAKLTRDVELLGKQDPFLRVTLLPWAKTNQIAKTKSKSNAGKQVTWSTEDENLLEVYFPGKPSSGEMPKIFVEVVDGESAVSKKLVGERVIGSGTLYIGELLKSGNESISNPIQLQVPLTYEDRGKSKDAGTCQLSLRFDTSKTEPGSKTDAPLPRVAKQGVEQAPHEMPATILFTALNGKDLKDTAWMGKQDPYVKVTLLPWNVQARTQPIKDGGTQVEWKAEHNNHLQIKYPGAKEDESPLLLVELFDEQVGGDRLIGAAVLEPSVFMLTKQRGEEEVQIRLENKGKPAGILSTKVATNVRTGVTGTRCGDLAITLVGTSLNKGSDWVGKTDPYVMISRAPGVPCPDQECKSVVQMDGGLASEFQQHFNVPLFDYGLVGTGKHGEAQRLQFTVMDKDTFSFDDQIGQGWKELGEVLSGDADYDPSYAHEVSIMKGKYTRGVVHAKLEFKPTKWRASEVAQVLAKKTGSLRVWALEARDLKAVGGLLDRKQDPYVVVHRQVRHGEPVPPPSKWKHAKSSVAVDAGSDCIWNSLLSVPHTPSDMAFAASTGNSGFLHIAVFDQGIMKDTLIGTKVINISAFLAQLDQQGPRRNDPAFRDDSWITLLDSNNKNAGQVRIAIDFSPSPPETTSNIAKAQDLGYVSSGITHLALGGVQGLPAATIDTVEVHVKYVQGTELQVHPENKRTKEKFKVVQNNKGVAEWNETVELSYNAPKLNPNNESIVQAPSLCLEVFSLFKGTLSSVFGKSKLLGVAIVPLCSLLPIGGDSSVTRAIPIVLNNKDTHASVILKALHVPEGESDQHAAAVASIGFDAAPAEKDNSRPTGLLLPKKDCHRTSGRFHVKVLEGRLLRDHDVLGKQDPFVEGKLFPGGSSFRTLTCQDAGKFPVWTEVMKNQHELLVSDASTALVTINCYDEDPGGQDHIGSVTIPAHVVSRWFFEKSAKEGTKDKKPLEPWETLVEGEEGFHNDNEKHKSKSAASAAFNSAGWKQWVEKLYRKCMVSADPQQESHQVVVPRRERLIQFYETYAKFKDDHEKIEKKVSEIDAKYLDEEPTNKSLFVKLYKIHAPHIECPASVWEVGMNHSLGSLAKDGQVYLTREEFPCLIDFIEPRVDSALQLREGTLKLSDERTKAVENHFDSLFPKKVDEWNLLTRERFEDCAKVIVSQLIISGVEDGTYSHSADLDVAVESDSDKQTKSWALVDAKGKPQGTLLLQTWFTDDWEPPNDEVNPNLLQEGSLWVQVSQAEMKNDKDLFGKQDPFLELSWMVGEEAVPKSFKPLKTKPKSGSGKSVTWSKEEGTFELKYLAEYGIQAYAQGSTPVLSLKLKDKDLLSSDNIGETRIPLLPLIYNANKIYDIELPIMNPSSDSLERNGKVQLRLRFMPKVLEDAKPVTPESAFPEISTDSDTAVANVQKLTGQLKINLVSGKHLKDVQWVGKMDPRVELCLWPYYETATSKKAMDEESNPTWNESFGMEVDDALLGLLQLRVVANGSKVVGTCNFPLYELITQLSQEAVEGEEKNVPSIENWFTLNDGKKASGELCLGISFHPRDPSTTVTRAMLSEPVQFIPGPGRLHFNIQKATDLRDVAMTGKQDPYVVIKGIGWRKPFEERSQVDQNGGKDPVFNFLCSGEIEWYPKDKAVPTVSIVIRDKGALRDSEIAQVELCVAPWLLAPGQLSCLWLPMYEEHSMGMSFGPYKHVPKKGMLNLMVQYIPDAEYQGKPAVPFDTAIVDHVERPITDVGEADEEQFKPREGDIHVDVIGARNLKDVQTFGTQDPYVKLVLITCAGGGDPPGFSSARTDTVDNGGSNPKWGTDLMLPYSENELRSNGGDSGNFRSSTPLLLCEIWDANGKLMRDERIGKVLLPIFPHVLDGRQIWDTWIPVMRSNGKPMGEVHLAVQVRNPGDKLQIARSLLPENILNVVVVRSQDLYNAGDTMGKQDPQVQVEFVGNDHVVKSKVATNSGTECYWGERLSLPGCMPDARGTLPRLRLRVVDVDVGSADDLIGQVEFSLTKKIMGNPERNRKPQPVEEWFELRDLKGQGSRGKVNLILRRGPFPGDEPSPLESELQQGRLIVDVQGANIEMGAKGDRLLARIRALGSLGGDNPEQSKAAQLAIRDTNETKLEDGKITWNSSCVVPFKPKKFTEDGEVIVQTLEVGVYERRWTLAGRKPKVVGVHIGIDVQEALAESQPGEVVQLSGLELLSKSGSSGSGCCGQINLSMFYVPFMMGQLRVKVLAVKGVTSMEMFSKNDLCCEVSVENGTANGSQVGVPQRTSVKNGAGAEAKFDETMHFAYSNAAETMLPCLRVRVLDIDTLSNDLCGVCHVPLTRYILDAFMREQSIENGVEPVQVAGHAGPREYLLLPLKDRPNGTLDDLENLTQTLPSGVAPAGTVVLDITFLPDSSTFQKAPVEEVEVETSEMRTIWKKLDKNKDGLLALDELLCGISSDISVAEFLSLPLEPGVDQEKQGRQAFKDMNDDSNEFVTFEEFSAYVEGIPARALARERRLEKERLAAEEAERQKRRSERAPKKEEPVQQHEKPESSGAQAAMERQKRLEEAEAERRRRQLEEQEQRRLDLEAKKLREAEEALLLDKIRRRRESELAAMALRRAKEEAEWDAREASRRAKQAESRASRTKPDRSRPGNVFLWRTRDVVEWLDGDLDLPQYVAAFAEGAVDGALLVQLTDVELEEHLGVVIPLHRRKIQLRARRLLKLATGEGSDEQSTSIQGEENIVDRSNVNAQVEHAGKNQLARAELVKKLRTTAEERRYRAQKLANQNRLKHFEYNKQGDDVSHDTDPAALSWYSSDSPRDEFDVESPIHTSMDNQVEVEASETAAYESAMKELHQTITESIRGWESPRLPDIESPARRERGRSRPSTPLSRPPLQLGPVRRVPKDATDHEVLEIVRQAVFRIGEQLIGKAAKDLEISADDEARLLHAVYRQMNKLKNNRHETSRSLSRLKFQGALKLLLRLDMSWSQFDSLFRLISPHGSDGTNSSIELNEFIAAFGNPLPHPPHRPRSSSSVRSKRSFPNSPTDRRREQQSDLVSLRNALFEVCQVLMESKLNLKEAFSAFDRNGSGFISLAEFSNVMQVLTNHQMTKRQIYYLMSCVDSKFDRKIHFDEFMLFWLMAYTRWLDHLRRKGSLQSNESLRQLSKKVERSLHRTFGSKYREIVDIQLKKGIPNSFESLLFATENSSGKSPLHHRVMRSPGNNLHEAQHRHEPKGKTKELRQLRKLANKELHNVLQEPQYLDTPKDESQLSPPELRGLASHSISQLLEAHNLENSGSRARQPKFRNEELQVSLEQSQKRNQMKERKRKQKVRTNNIRIDHEIEFMKESLSHRRR